MSNRKFGWHSGAVHCKSLTLGGGTSVSGEVHVSDIAASGALSSSSGLVGQNVVLTTQGTAGAWASALYAKVTEGTTKNVNGYLCAAEFELAIAGTYNASDAAVLVLNSTMTNSGGAISHPAYIYIREYGTKLMDNLLWFGDASIGTTSKTTLLSTTADLAATHTIKVLIGATPVWILCNNVGP
jgi:hypothetical protein